MVDAAQLRYENELLVPFYTYFGKRQLHEYLHGRHVLDFGCSKGGVARSIIEQFAPASLSGVDVEENNLTAARLLFDVNHMPAQFYLYDGNILPFNNNTFETAFIVLMYLNMFIT